MSVAPGSAGAAGDGARRAWLEATVELREVRTNEEAQALGFPGSPTIRVDGRDVDAVRCGGPTRADCRIYYLADGRVSPIPSREQLEEALT